MGGGSFWVLGAVFHRNRDCRMAQLCTPELCTLELRQVSAQLARMTATLAHQRQAFDVPVQAKQRARSGQHRAPRG